MKVPVSILIPIKNEAANLPRCLQSVSWADQIYVVDSQSQDGSQAIAQAHGAQVVQFHFNGTWPKKKNWAIDSLPFKHQWILILDADEVLPPDAEAEIRQITTAPDSQHAGYWINRRFMFMNKWLKHAYYPNWNLRLFKHRLGRYEKLTDVNTASGDNEVHEHLLVDGSTGSLNTQIDHYAFPSVEVFVEKHNRYSNWEARVATSASSPDAQPPQNRTVRSRRRLKQLAHRLPCRPLLRFLYIYLWQLGFLDGREGYYFARLHAFYEFLSLTKTYELKKTAPDHADLPTPTPGQRGQKTWLARSTGTIFWACLCVVLFFAWRPSPNGERVHGIPNPLGQWINQHDAAANFLCFTVLAGLMFGSNLNPAKQPCLTHTLVSRYLHPRFHRLTLFFCLIVSLEAVQLLIPGRVFDIKDIAVGWIAGLLVFLTWHYTSTKRHLTS